MWFIALQTQPGGEPPHRHGPSSPSFLSLSPPSRLCQNRRSVRLSWRERLDRGSFLLLPLGEQKREDLTKELVGSLFQPSQSVFRSSPLASVLALLDPCLPGLVPSIISLPQRRLSPDEPQWKIPISEWPNVLCRVVDHQETLRKVADDYGVSYETIRRGVSIARQKGKSSEESENS